MEAMGVLLDLDGAEGEATDDLLLQDQRDQDDGKRIDHRERGHRAPVEAVGGLELCDHDRRGDGPLGGQQERVQKLVPGGDEAEERGDGDAAFDDRQDRVAEGVEPRAAVHARRLLEVVRHGFEEGRHQPDRQRNAQRRVRQHQAKLGVEQADASSAG